MPGTALVTGAASGIGRATAHALAARGYVVAVNHLDRAVEAKQVANDVGGIAYDADVSDVTAVAAMVQAAEADLGPLDVAVACAGFDVDVPLADVTPELWDRSLAVILGGCASVIATVGPRMRARRRGSIVAISSELALLGDEDHVHYVTAKSAILGLVRSVAREYGPDQVRVNAICPGPTDTEMLTERWRAEDYRLGIPLQRFGTPAELARAIVDVAEWTWLTGQVVSPNGGVVIQ
ncbi:3-oxoacyl-ACP reductase [Mycolicibacterium madagascariense]|uniref:3-oxoacyl-ACP reductase n=1 Tax=Mycolicibacterium madagascariense TaxID=212765 RepID=A0A7I7XI38_9MYCO|nr:SDR family oxidoreductase [Mycolicibacterium madagascariense]MCV7015791.1 SDR family oxidoreductase [Mycolicibacterium madagascariense]BBZ28844.1 3-oxoacyl-ACP reductase [Mycolicibacterium madagascariense]